MKAKYRIVFEEEVEAESQSEARRKAMEQLKSKISKKIFLEDMELEEESE